jgi:RNA polymerase sigma-70 factor, ECF subfamily
MHPEPPDPLDDAVNDSDRLSAQTDAALFAALKTGQTRVLGVLYDRHAGLVYGIALRVLSHPQDAEDLTQDIFLQLATCSYNPARGALRTFLAILTRSRALDRIRAGNTQRRRLQQYGARSETTPSNLPLDSVYQTEQAQELQSALAQLSDSQQQILKLSYYDGLSQAEIAERLQVPLGTVKSKARRGLLLLRQTLNDSMR